MNHSIFDEDLYFEDKIESENWSKDNPLIDLIQFDQHPQFLNYQTGKNQLSTHTNVPVTHQNNQIPLQFSTEKNQIQNQSIPILSQFPNSPPPLCKCKSKKICKSQKPIKPDITQDRRTKPNRKPSSSLSSKPKSKYNNMGGFLIGTFAEILQTELFYRLESGQWLVFINGNSMALESVQIEDFFDVERSLRDLKEAISKLPRKQGAKKHLFDLVNEVEADSRSTRKSKSILRKELVLGLSREFWLEEHVQSRDFKPENDNQEGTKKKERHQDYMTYLQAIRLSLVTLQKLPKRINV